MVDETNQNKQDEQGYEFPKETSKEYGAGAHSGGTEHIMSVLKNQRVMYALGGVLGLYILLSLFSGGSDSEIQPVEDAPAISAPTPTEMTEPQAPVETKTSFNTFDELMGESTKKDEELEKLQKSVSSLNRQYADSRARLQDLDKKVDDLTLLVNRTSTQLSKLIDEDDKRQQSSAKKDVVLKEFKIRAILSGRAWLEDKNGNNLTVKVGDKLPTYGRITEIKPEEGVVITSSGRSITFSTMND